MMCRDVATRGARGCEGCDSRDKGIAPGPEQLRHHSPRAALACSTELTRASFTASPPCPSRMAAFQTGLAGVVTGARAARRSRCRIYGALRGGMYVDTEHGRPGHGGLHGMRDESAGQAKANCDDDLLHAS